MQQIISKEHPDVDRNHDGKIQYVILEGEMGHQDAIIRTESVAESLKEQGDCTGKTEVIRLQTGIVCRHRTV